MASDDLNKKNTPKENLPDKEFVNGKAADEETRPAEEKEAEPSPAADPGSSELITEPDADAIREVTAEELEEESMDNEETEFESTKGCRCMEVDGDYYCFKLQQGRWIQWSLIPYPTKKICEAACCNS